MTAATDFVNRSAAYSWFPLPSGSRLGLVLGHLTHFSLANPTRWGPLIAFLVFLGVGVVWRSYAHYQRHGEWGIQLFHRGGWVQRIRDGLFLVVVVLLFVQVLAFAVAPDAIERALVLPAALAPFAKVGGAALVALGTLVMAVAQIQLGASWRIGIDPAARPGLVTRGIYRYCRNPIFLAMFMGLAGLALWVPTWISLAILASAAWAIRAQVLDEERYLLGAYGDDYRAYASQVGRFLPGLGRLFVQSR